MIVLSGFREARSCWTKRKPRQVSDQKGTVPGSRADGAPRPAVAGGLPGPAVAGAGTRGFCRQANRLCINHPIFMDLEEFSQDPHSDQGAQLVREKLVFPVLASGGETQSSVWAQ